MTLSIPLSNHCVFCLDRVLCVQTILVFSVYQQPLQKCTRFFCFILMKSPNRADTNSRLPKWYFSVQNLRLMRYDESILFLTFSCLTLFVQPLSEWRYLPSQRINLFLLLSLWPRRNYLLRSEHDVFKLILICKMYIYVFCLKHFWNFCSHKHM